MVKQSDLPRYDHNKIRQGTLQTGPIGTPHTMGATKLNIKEHNRKLITTANAAIVEALNIILLYNLFVELYLAFITCDCSNEGFLYYNGPKHTFLFLLSRCPTYINVPSNCQMVKAPGECCSHPDCHGTGITMTNYTSTTLISKYLLFYYYTYS